MSGNEKRRPSAGAFEHATAQVVVGAAFDAEGGRCARFGGIDDIDDAVQCIGAIHRCAGPANDFDAARLLGVGFEQFVDVTEAGRAQRHAVFHDQDRATGTGAGQDRGANGRQVFLPVVAVKVDPGHAVEGFLHVAVGGELERFAIE